MRFTDQEILTLRELARLHPGEGLTIEIGQLFSSFRQRNWQFSDLKSAVADLHASQLVEFSDENKVCITEQGIAALKFV
jgi:hypothetical protein